MDYSFRTTNCYGLSADNRALQVLEKEFPYNELLWFIKLKQSKNKKATTVSVQRIVMVYLC